MMRVHHGALHELGRRRSKDIMDPQYIWFIPLYKWSNLHAVTKNKTSDKFINFIKKVDILYNYDIKTIFVVLDNASIRSSKRKEMQ